MILLSAANVEVSLAGVPVLTGADVAVSGGEVVGLIGPNGAGKTTLLRAMAGLQKLDGGEIRFAGGSLKAIARKALARALAYLPQGSGSHWAVTVETLVMLGRLPHREAWRAPTGADWTAVERALAACDVARLRERPVTQLSGGELSRVLLARALAADPKVLLADEPVSGLDPGHQLDVMKTLKRLAEAGAGVIVVMHDLTLASRFCERLALLHDGRIVADGSPATVLSPELLARCYGVRAYRGAIDGSPFIVPLERTDGGGHAPL